MSETFTMALAILNCHGIRDLPNNIQRKHKDVLTLDYMGLKFKVASENADKVSRFIKDFVFFYRQYQFNGGTEYDSLPIYKIVETISREFKNRVNALIKPEPTRQSFIETRVLGSEPCARSYHEQFRAMNNELVSCKLLPYKRIEKTGKGIFGVKIVQDAKMENGKMAENGKRILAEDLKTGNGRERNRRGDLRSGVDRRDCHGTD